MATCAAIGQGVGTAAALALRAGVEPAAIAVDRALVDRIQQRLLRNDAYLLGVARGDQEELASSASVTASSAQPGGEPALVLSAQTRAVHGLISEGGALSPPGTRHGADEAAPSESDPATAPARCANQWENVLKELETGRAHALYTSAPPDRAAPGAHRWMSEPAAGLPAALELRWPTPVSIREIQLIFDTGLHRFLTLSQADGYTARMLWGRPQPETVRDYRIEAAGADGWRTVHTEVGNYQRRRVHRWAESLAAVAALRLVVTATNGLDHARICEVRVYS